MRKKNALCLFLSIVISFILSSYIICAIGISPATINYDDMVRGGYAERYVTVSNTEEEAIQVRIGIEGDVGKWVRAEPDNATIEPMTTAIFKIIANPPADIPNGAYSGTALAVGQPVSAAAMQGTGVATVSGVAAIIHVSISDTEVRGYGVESLTAYDTEECRDIVLRITVRNTGNVRVSPKFAVEIKDKGQSQVLQKAEVTEADLLPTKIQTYTMKVPYSMEQFKCIPEGDYYADFRAYSGSELVRQELLPFSIHQRGFLTIAGEIQKITAKSNASMGEVVKIDVLFKNIGKLPVNAKVRGEIYQDGVLTGVIESDQKEFSMGVADTLSLYFTPGWVGKYTIKITGIYEGKETAPKEIIIEVVPSTSFYGGIAVAALAAIGGIAYVIMKKRKGKGRKK